VILMMGQRDHAGPSSG
ncbi:hypothetical protein, partial [Chromobacterium piscinae]